MIPQIIGGVFLIGFLALVVAAICIFLFVFWVLMIIDCAKRKRWPANEQVIWILVIILLGFIGALIYYFAVKRKHA